MESTLLSNNISKQKEMDTPGNKRQLTRKKNKGKNAYFRGNVCELSSREKSNMSVTSSALKKNGNATLLQSGSNYGPIKYKRFFSPISMYPHATGEAFQKYRLIICFFKKAIMLGDGGLQHFILKIIVVLSFR